MLGQRHGIRSVNTNVELKSLNLTPTAVGARSLHILDKSTFGQADRVAAGDDDVMLLRRAGPFVRHALARHRRVRGVTLTRLPDSPPKRVRVRCHFLVAIDRQKCGSPLQQTPLREARSIAPRNYHMIQEANVDETQGLLQALRDELIRLRGFCDSARVRVGENYGGGVLFERFFHDFAWVNGRAVDRALEHLLVADEPVALVEEDHGEDFSLECS